MGYRGIHSIKILHEVADPFLKYYVWGSKIFRRGCNTILGDTVDTIRYRASGISLW